MKIFSAKYTADYYYVKKLISVISFYNTGLILPLLTTACLIQRRNISQLILSGKNPILVKEIMSFEGLWEQVQQQRYYSTLHRFAKAGIYYWSSLNLSEFLFPTERHPASSTSLLYSLYHLFIPKDQDFMCTSGMETSLHCRMDLRATSGVTQKDFLLYFSSILK